MKDENSEKIKFTEKKYLNKEVSFLSEGEKGEDITIVGEVIAVTSEGELRIKDKENGFVYIGTPEDVGLVSKETEEEETKTSDKEEEKEPVETKEKEEETVSETKKDKVEETESLEPETTKKEESVPVATEKEKPKVKDQIFAEILIREGGGNIESLTADLQKEVGGSMKENEYKVRNFMRFLTFLGVAELEDEIYFLHLK